MSTHLHGETTLTDNACTDLFAEAMLTDMRNNRSIPGMSLKTRFQRDGMGEGEKCNKVKLGGAQGANVCRS